MLLSTFSFGGHSIYALQGTLRPCNTPTENAVYFKLPCLPIIFNDKGK